MIRWIKYVEHRDVPQFEELGWTILQPNRYAHHDQWGCEMEWKGPDIGEPPLPPNMPRHGS